MSAPTRLESNVWTSPRFFRLGRSLAHAKGISLPKDDLIEWAAGKMGRIYSHCTEYGTDILSEDDIAFFIGDGLADGVDPVQLLVGSNLAVVTRNGVRIKGCAGRTTWLEQKRAGAKKGGEKRASSAKRGKDGRFRKGEKPIASAPPAKAGPAAPAKPSAMATTTTTVMATTKKRVRKKKPPALPGYRECVDEFFLLYAEQTNGAKYDFGAKDGKLLSDLVKRQGSGEVLKRMRYMFSGSVPWLKGAYTVGSFKANFNALVDAAPKPGARIATEGLGGDDLRHLAEELERIGQ